ncbi:MAG: nucleotidyltransferase domain-containing protein [Fibromonadaceae bacterium]|jgi:predicted nucleotidyltransferase|nr:nucleotidyltransferase domain-containing protein [Fibromonadaceae bacterium]
MNNQYFIEEMTERLKELKPRKVILFGSYAKGTETEDSDLDVLVVLDSNERSKTFSELMERSKPVSAAVREVRKKMAMDLIVYTMAEFEFLRKQKDFFVEEIVETGKILYEKTELEIGEK